MAAVGKSVKVQPKPRELGRVEIPVEDDTRLMRGRPTIYRFDKNGKVISVDRPSHLMVSKRRAPNSEMSKVRL